MQHQQRMKQAAAAAQQQQMMQQALLMQQQQAAAVAAAAQQQQAPLFPPHHPHPGLLAAPQIEPIVSGNLPPGFDSSTCRSVYVGNIHLQVTDSLLHEVFQSIGPVEGCKLIRKEKSSFGFVDYYDRRSAAIAIVSLNGRQLDARVMWDQKTGRSRGFGFVSFRNQQDAQNAINELNGKWLGNRQVRCNWATKGANAGEEKQNTDSKGMIELTNGSSEGGKDNANEDGPENNPQYTTVYVGNLPHDVNSNDVHRFFHSLGVGSIEEVRVTRDKGFGFVRYSTHEEAALAIQTGNGQLIGGRQIKCSWGSKPTPPGTASAPLPPPAPTPFNPGMSATDLLAYERTLALSKMAANPALMSQHAALKQAAAMGMGAGASQAIYDGGYQSANAVFY
uniref:Putative nucleolysin n=1 Tax=Oryza sativa subsp. indica TaxID=39946 RepID=Q9XF32_ORYSI|nr:putative nucleolysin [Oryza sativa Indica Group]